MLLRPRWLRLRRHWVCYGIGTLCATTLAISGCSRAPMARFKELTSAPDSESSAEKSSAAATTPDPRDAVASTRKAPDTAGRVTVAGDGPRRGAFKRYREGYANLGSRLLDRETPGGAQDSFVNPGDPRDFPATDSLVPSQRPPAGSAAADDSIARADLRPERAGAVGTASLQRPATSEGVAHTAPSQASRLEQLRAELRAERDAGTGGPSAVPTAAETDRGVVLSGPRSSGEGVARVGIGDARPFPGGQSSERAAAGLVTSVTETGPARAGTEETYLRVQSLLASAEWLAQRGDLEEAYRNAVLAQHLADYAGLQISPADRQPVIIAHGIWEAIQKRDSSSELARSLPRPHVPSGINRQPVPANAFPGSELTSWQRASGRSSLPSQEGGLPLVTPQGTAPPVLAAPGTTTDPVVPSASELSDVAQAVPAGQDRSASPVTIARIDVDASTAGPSAAAKEPASESSSGSVVTALAETGPRPVQRRRRADPADPGPAVPAMASLPKVEQPLPLEGPALGGRAVAQAEPAPAPPYLEVIGARQLPTDDPPARTSRKRGVLWGLGGLVAALLGAAFLFRRRWSAGAAGRQK